jgi:plastocyanin
MKKYSVLFMSVFMAILLTSCSMHLGLGKLLGNKSTPTKAKHVKATHTPPSPPSATAMAPNLTPAPNTIMITNAGYQPNSLQVKVGTTITWTNTDSAAHTVTSDTAGVFDSGPINTNATFTFTFSQAGTFTYHSTGETSVTGTVVVTQ